MDKSKNTATISKWGVACSPCALAKAKCLRPGGAVGSRCERCTRLGKDCLNQIHKPRKKRQSRPSKTAQLEERLNSLVDFLKVADSRDIPTPLRNALESRQLTPPLKGPGALRGSQREEQVGVGTESPTQEMDHGSPYMIPDSYNEHAPRVCVCRAQAGEVPVPLEPDDALLSTFVTKLMPHYPFVVIPLGTTALELSSKKPFLFAAIRMVASYRNLKSMRSQNYFMMRHISEHMLMRSEKSLEMLQAILLILGYYHYHCMIHAQMNNLIALANSMVADLCINKPPDLQERTKLLATDPENPEARTNDERRALCGVWYITSLNSLTFQRTDSPKYTTYIERCVGDLEADNEYETDSLLVHLVRIQHLSERISQLYNNRWGNDGPTGIAHAPISAHAVLFHAELEQVRASVPQHLKSNVLIMGHLNTASLRLCEPPRIDAELLEKVSNSLTSLCLDSASSFLDIFYRSSAALRTWFDYWLSVDVGYYFLLPMSVSAHLITAVMMLARWAKLSGPGAHHTPGVASMTAPTVAQAAPENTTAGTAPTLGANDIDPMIPPEVQIDVRDILQAMATRFEQARHVVAGEGEMWENDIWDMAARKIKATGYKLERWAEMVASVGGESSLGRKPSSTDNDNPRRPNRGSEGTERRNWLREVGVDSDPPISFSREERLPGASWANDVFEGLGLDRDFFFDGPGDYGTAILSSLELSDV
ncbi:hypothetical protein GGS23DRAFT_603235 [Durotheca rogersii]|uniref:uncharacterized protein n=1 Tax=Durotheca rogersii TaxID=419775 RepID=UPI00221F795E|nr:uncharacterized protein GGS23DRAFT_603235 [Durotheca rogersii]KAI5865679.1 hypothetical protein GGS23DRAFT_603235 [Durotheca rogersii]